MNIEQMTQKTREALQAAQRIAVEYSTAMRCAACKASRVFCVICSMFIVRTSFSADSALFWQSRT